MNLFSVTDLWTKWTTTLGILLIGFILLGFLGGCAMFDPVGQMTKLIENPGIQATLEKWQVDANADDPEIIIKVGTFASLQANRVKMGLGATGDVRSSGIDAERLDKLTSIMERLASKLPNPTSQPATKEEWIP